MTYTYKVVPAPRTGRRIKKVRGDAARFSLTLEELINEYSSEGWEYLRADTLPCEHRGWFSRKTEQQTLLVFRRGNGGEDEIPVMPANLRTQSEPRLAADRTPPRRTETPILRAAPPAGHGRDG